MQTSDFINLKLDIFETEPVISITLDIDWASEAVIDTAHQQFEKRYIKPTYFVTHPSPYLIERDQRNEAKFGIHPNFLKDSDHGSNYFEVSNYFNQFPPSWRKVFRSHRYYDVTDINILMRSQGFEYDSNVFSFLTKINPYRHFTGLVRYPSCWEDGTHLDVIQSLEINQLKEFIMKPGLTILGMHPLHLAMNSPNMAYNRNLKKSLTRENMRELSHDDIKRLRYEKRGIKNLIEDMLDYIFSKNLAVMTLEEIHNLVAN